MNTPSSHEVTQLLVAWGDGDQAALEQLTPLVYRELHRLAKGYLHRERPGHILQTTAIDPRRSRMVELRFFGGLSEEETAEALKMSPQTVRREWSLARAWLHRELNKTVTSDE